MLLLRLRSFRNKLPRPLLRPPPRLMLLPLRPLPRLMLLPLRLLPRLMPPPLRLALLLMPLLLQLLTLPRLLSKKPRSKLLLPQEKRGFGPFFYYPGKSPTAAAIGEPDYCNCCCNKPSILRAVAERSTPPSLVRTCTVELLVPLLLT